MQMRLCMCAILASLPALAGERMTVSVCIRGRLGEKSVAGAQSAAADLFRAADIEVAWAGCDIAPEGDEAARQHWFTLRFRNGRPFIPPSLGTLDALGEAFTSLEQPGYVAEVYYEQVATLAQARQVDSKKLLGYVMAHELAHLLLGPRHAPVGLMRAAWDAQDLAAMRQGSLRFNAAEGTRLREALHGAVGRAATAP